MRLVVGIVTATVCHALLLLGLRWTAPAPRTVAAPERPEMIEVQIVAPEVVALGFRGTTVWQGGPPRREIPGSGSARRSGRSRPPVRFEASAGTTIAPEPMMATESAVTPTGASPVAHPTPPQQPVHGGGEGALGALADNTSPGAPSARAHAGAGGPSGLVAARYRSHPAPPYPLDSLRLREEGVVLLSVDVDLDGRATQISLSRGSGSASLDGAAIDAVYGWTFEPARNAGLPVASRVVVPVRFALVGR